MAEDLTDVVEALARLALARQHGVPANGVIERLEVFLAERDDARQLALQREEERQAWQRVGGKGRR